MTANHEQNTPPENAVLTSEQKAEIFEENESYIQDLKKLKTIWKTHASGLTGLRSRDDKFIIYPHLYDPDALQEVGEYTYDYEGHQISSVRLRFPSFFEVNLVVNKRFFPKWKEIETPSEGGIYPGMERGMADYDNNPNHLLVHGPADSLGPNALKIARTLTRRALLTFQFPEY